MEKDGHFTIYNFNKIQTGNKTVEFFQATKASNQLTSDW